MSTQTNFTSRPLSAVHHRPVASTPAADKSDRALADIRTWTQLLVARGNRLLELAVREREDVARGQASMRAGASKHESFHAKPRA